MLSGSAGTCSPKLDRNWMISEGKPGHGQHVACIQSGNLTRTNMKLRGIRDTCKRVLQSFPGSGGCERSVLSAFSHKCCFSKKAPRVLWPLRGGWPSNLGNTCRHCETPRVTVEMWHRRNSFHCDRLPGRLANIGRVQDNPAKGLQGVWSACPQISCGQDTKRRSEGSWV